MKQLSFTHNTIPPFELLRRTIGATLLVISTLGIGSAAGNFFLNFDINIFLAETLGVHIIGMAFISISFVHWLGRDVKTFLKLHRPNTHQIKQLIYIVIGSLIVFSMLFILLQSIDDVNSTPPVPGVTTQRGFIFALPILFFLSSPAEEILFRGVIQSYIQEISPPIIAITITSICFTIVHIPIYIFNGQPLLNGLISLTVVFILSLIFSGIYEITETLYAPIVLHSLYNVLVVVLFLV